MKRARTLASMMVEALVIIGSILLAFAVDAAWDGRQEGIETRGALRAVESELGENLAYFAFAEETYNRAANSGFELLHLTGPEAVAEDPDHVSFLIGEIWLRPNIDPPGTGAIESLLASGALARIDQPALRQELSLWPEYIRRQHELMDLASSESLFWQRMLLFIPQLDFDLVNGMAAAPEVREAFVERAPAGSRFPGDWDGLLADRQFESGVTSRTTGALAGAWLATRTQTRIKSLLAQIRAYLDES